MRAAVLLRFLLNILEDVYQREKYGGGTLVITGVQVVQMNSALDLGARCGRS